MHAPLARQLLNAWERGLAQPPAARALLLLAEAHPDASLEELAALPLARRDRMLLDLREHLFGSELSTVATCPSCSFIAEATFAISELRVGGADDLAPATSCELEGYRVTFRLPSSADLLTVLSATPSQASALLFGRCIVEARHEEQGDIDVEALPESVAQAVVARMAEAAAHADMELALTCSACARGWNVAFDAVSYVWQELHTWAKRTLRDVANLARIYGWSEGDALALSPTRRRLYLELGGA